MREDVTVSTASISELLAEWRAAERRWERHAPDVQVRVAGLEVVWAWAAYQDAALPAGTREFMLVADDEGKLVGTTRGARFPAPTYRGCGQKTSRKRVTMPPANSAAI